MIPYGHQDISLEDIQAVENVLKSEFLTQGPVVPQFERALAEYCTAAYGIATNSATSALHIACLALDLGPGDWLWTSPNTFVASANCGLYCGAKIDFVDIDSRTYNLSVEKLTEKLERSAKDGTLPKIVIPVHFAGQSCDMAEINALSKKYGFKIIEDASHAIGAKYCGEPVGNCKFSDITVFSFHPVKIITTGEGGIATTNSQELAEKMRRLRSHGITRDPELMSKRPDGQWYYQQIDLGFNYRMTDIQAALGLSQMQRLEEMVSQRGKIAKAYNVALSKLPIILPYCDPENLSSNHLYVIKVDPNKRSQIFNELRDDGVGVNVHYIPVHRQPYYQQFGFKSVDYPVSEKYYSQVISLPIYSSLKVEDLNYVVEHLTKSVLKKVDEF